MSCILLEAKSFEALAVSLCAHKVPVPSPVAPNTTIAAVFAWAALAWEASAANGAAYSYRYNEPVAWHPLQVVHGTPEAFTAWLFAQEATAGRTARHRSELGLLKLMRCLVYQLVDASPGHKASDVGAALDLVSQRIALSILQRLPAYADEPWGDEVTP